MTSSESSVSLRLEAKSEPIAGAAGSAFAALPDAGAALADGTAAEIFGNDQVVNEARIRRPQLAQLALDLGLQGILNGDELVNALD